MDDEFAELLGNLERQFLAQFGQPLKAIDLYVVARKHLSELQERFIHNHICHLKGDRAARLEKTLHDTWIAEHESQVIQSRAYLDDLDKDIEQEFEAYVEEQKKESAGRDAGDDGSNGVVSSGGNILNLPDRRKSKGKSPSTNGSPKNVL